MANTGKLSTDKLFKGLTRPAMFLGVSYTFALFNMVISMVLFILTNEGRLLLFIGLSIHIAGYLICSKEPLFIELYMIKFQKCNRCSNKFYHGANSYDVTF